MPLSNKKHFDCGVGGVRTLVQTTSFQAFYMLISRLVFDRRTDKNTQTYNLATGISQMLSNLAFTSPMG